MWAFCSIQNKSQCNPKPQQQSAIAPVAEKLRRHVHVLGWKNARKSENNYQLYILGGSELKWTHAACRRPARWLCIFIYRSQSAFSEQFSNIVRDFGAVHAPHICSLSPTVTFPIAISYRLYIIRLGFLTSFKTSEQPSGSTLPHESMKIHG